MDANFSTTLNITPTVQITLHSQFKCIKGWKTLIQPKSETQSPPKTVHASP